MPFEPFPLDYVIAPQTPSPPDYPFGPMPNEYSQHPFDPEYLRRRQAFLDFVLHSPAPTNLKAAYYELARQAAGGTPHTGIFMAAMDYVDARKDGSDVIQHSLLRLLYQFAQPAHIDKTLLDRARQTTLNFKYWPGEPGIGQRAIDSMCTWTENHYLMFTSAAYLAGQLYPDQAFTNSGLSGQEMMALNRHRLLRWLNLRFFTGFSEWLSHVYYDEDLTALLSLVDFCQDEEICLRATMIVDLLLLEMAVHNFCGVFGSSHGRSYEHTKKWASQECTTDTQKLLFGCGVFTASDNCSAVCFALSPRYHLPQVIYNIAQDRERQELLHRQRMGICLDQASWWGLNFKNLEDGMLLLTLEAYFHPRTVRLFVKMLDTFDWWNNENLAPFNRHRSWLKILSASGLLPSFVRLFQKDLCRTTREEVNLYTYRTPDYMLSSAQDYRKGYGGDQQHLWQATLGPNAVCFTTHPARPFGRTPNYWSGSGVLPTVAQVKNVAVVIYRISRAPALFVHNELVFTHAWFPRDQFNEVIEKDGWIFACHGEGYLALFSQHPYEWRTRPGEDQDREIITKGRDNIWVCEMGRRQVDGEFSEFIQRILQTELFFSGSQVTYHSPSQGWIEFSWKGPLRQDGHAISQKDYPRYASPYVQASFPPEQIEIIHDGHYLRLDWLAGSRKTDSFIEMPNPSV